LRTSLALPPKKRPTRAPDEVEDTPQTSVVNSNFTSHYLETEIDHERVGITLWDSQGLDKNVVDLQLREITSFLESKFEDTFNEEMKVVRAPGVRDTHIHCAFLILDPARLDANITAAQKAATGASGKSSAVRVVGGLDEDLDLQVLRTMQGKTTVVPIISKADTVTTAHMAYLKKTVWDSLKKANLDPLEAVNFDDLDDDSMSDSVDRFDERDEDAVVGQAITVSALRLTPESDTIPLASVNRSSPSRHTEAAKRKSGSSISSSGASAEYFLPLSILSPDPHSLEANDEPVGRKFPWGFADPYNREHCDFQKLKDTVFGEWRGELREASREIWYERWRTSRLNPNGTSAAGNYRNGSSKGAAPRSSRLAR
jgi:septin family protein